MGDRQVSRTRRRLILKPGSCEAARRAQRSYTFRQPGIYAYVNHNLIEAVELGATAHFKVEGEWNNDLMEQISPPGPIPATAKLHGRWPARQRRRSVSEGGPPPSHEDCKTCCCP